MMQAYRVIDEFSIKTKAGQQTIAPGQVIRISPAKALRLIEGGKLKQLENISDQSDREESGATNPSPTSPTEARRKSLEDCMTATLAEVRDEIQAGGKWSFTQDVQKAEDHISEVWRAVLIGKAKLSEFREACVAWRAVGTQEENIKITNESIMKEEQ